MHKEMPCSTVSISVTHVQFRSCDFTVLSSAFCTLHKEGNCACSFHSPEAVSYAQEMFNKCFNGQLLPFQGADLYLRAHAKLTSYITFQSCIDLKVEMKLRLFFFPVESKAQAQGTISCDETCQSSPAPKALL